MKKQIEILIESFKRNAKFCDEAQRDGIALAYYIGCAATWMDAARQLEGLKEHEQT